MKKIKQSIRRIDYLLVALSCWAAGSMANAATNNYNYGGQGFGYGHGAVMPPANMTFTNAGIRDVTVSAGQLSGVNPETGAALSGSDLLPLKAQSLAVVGGTISGNGSGLNELNASAISSGTLSPSLETDPQVGANTTAYVPKWNGSELVSGTVYDNGNVGIGTSTPGGKLHVKAGASQYAGVFQADQAPETWTMTFSAFNLVNADPTVNNHAMLSFSDAAGGASSAGMGVSFVDRANHYGDLYFYTKGPDFYQQRLYVKANGNVGIGTDAPSQKLEVAGTVKAVAFSGNGAGLTINPAQGDIPMLQ
jgi:hypothetical protein